MVDRQRKAALRSEPGIARAIVDPVIGVLEKLGFDAPPEVLADGAGPMVRGAVADRLLEEASERLGEEALGILLAERIPIGGLGLIDYALCTSSTLRDALGRVALHYGLATERVKLGLVEEPPRASLVFERQADLSHGRHWLEFSFAVIAARVRQTISRDVVFEACFRHPAPKDSAAHDAYFGSHVSFSSAEDRLSLAHELLDASLRTASGSLAELLDAKIRELDPSQNRDPFLDRARHVAAGLLDQRDVRLESVAARLHVTRRTLQRELHRRGTSHKEIVDAVRRERAQTLLGQALTVKEVAERLAYSEASAFFRAFRRWTGTSPRARSK